MNRNSAAQRSEDSGRNESPELREGTQALTKPSLPWRAGHVFALSGFAFAQPLFGLLGTEAEFWIARQATTFEVAVLILVVVVGIPLLMLGVESLIWMIDSRAGWLTHLAIVGVLVAILLLQSFDNVVGDRWPQNLTMSLAVGGGLAFALVYRSFRLVRDFVGILVIAPVVFVGLFVIQLPPLGGYDVPLVDANVTEGNPVVVIVFDEFHLAGIQNADGTIDGTRFPGIAALAESSTWYRYATTVDDNSLKAIPALLTGVFPGPDRLAVASDYPTNLFTVMGSTHELVVHEDITQLCPPSQCVSTSQDESVLERLRTLLADSAVVYLHTAAPDQWVGLLPDIGVRWSNFLAADYNEDVEAQEGSAVAELIEATNGDRRAVAYGTFLDALDPELGSALYYLHVDLPHVPWTLLPSGARYPELAIAGTEASGVWLDDKWLVQQGLLRSLLQIGFTDSLISLMTARLKALNMWNDALVVVVADHGQEFAVNEPRRALTESNMVGIGAVPMFVKFPNQVTGVQDDTNTQTIDLLPTIATALGGSLDDTDGVALQRPDRLTEKTMTSRDGQVYSVDFDTYLAMEERYRASILELVPAGVGITGMFANAGPRPDLFGASPDSRRQEVVGGEVKFVDPSLFLDYQWSSGVDPVAVQFSIETDDPVEFYAVSVNGTILATISPYRLEASKVWALGFVPPGSFREGDNVVEVFGISGTSEATILLRYR